jgi:RNA polymerase sigma-70 factor (ECF subfamily)
MFKDDIVPGAWSATVSSTVDPQNDADSANPSSLEDEVVALFDQLQGKLLRYLLSLGLAAPDGEEIIQEVFLALFKHLRLGKPRQNLRAWTFQVAHNLALKNRNMILRSRQNVLEFDRTSDNALVDRAPNPEDQLALNWRRVKLLSVWQALPERGRLCLALRAEGLTYREIAKVLDISLGAVSLSLARSIARFVRANER